MSYLDLLFMAAVLGGSLAAKRDALARPPQELLENIELFDDLPFLETDGEGE